MAVHVSDDGVVCWGEMVVVRGGSKGGQGGVSSFHSRPRTLRRRNLEQMKRAERLPPAPKKSFESPCRIPRLVRARQPNSPSSLCPCALADLSALMSDMV
jgi:hypothetical protein